MKFFQKLGKSLMLPVCVLPICGILMGIGYALCPASMQGGEITGAAKVIGYLLVKTGGAIIDNMAVLFVIGVAVGMSEDGHGTAALSGIVSWLVVTSLLSPAVMNIVYGGLAQESGAYQAFAKIKNPTIGMLCGLVGAICYNKFKNTKLPDFLAFFSGKRSVALVTVVVSMVLTVVLSVVWPLLYSGMLMFGAWVASLGGIGAGVYAFLNRLLIPTGMHHALNNIFWFDTIGLGDLSKFWAGKTSEEVGWSLGMYMSGFFPCMIGGIPGAAFAIYKTAKNKKKAMGILFSTAFCAFLCGLTEPFEFSFMFLCFPLYVVYSLLYGIFTVIAYYLEFRAGFSFSAGLVDLIFSSTLPAAKNTWLILPLSILAFVLFYFAFLIMIKKFKVSIIPGDENADTVLSDGLSPAAAIGAAAKRSGTKEEENLVKARGILKAVGGKGNVTGTDCCATRLRLDLKDSSVVDRDLAKKYGAIDVICPSKTSCQVIIGLTVQQVLEAFRVAMEEPETAEAGTAGAAGTATGGTITRKEPAGTPVIHGETMRIFLKKTRNAEETKESTGGESAFSYKESTGGAPALPLTEEDGALVFRYVVKDPSGIHARPAGQIAQIVKDSGAEVTVEAGGKTASASSPVQMMGLGVKGGTEITVKVRGGAKEAETAAAELSRFIANSL